VTTLRLGLWAVANPSVVCRLSFCTLAILWPPCKVLRRISSQGNPSIWGVKRKTGSKIERCHVQLSHLLTRFLLLSTNMVDSIVSRGDYCRSQWCDAVEYVWFNGDDDDPVNPSTCRLHRRHNYRFSSLLAQKDENENRCCLDIIFLCLGWGGVTVGYLICALCFAGP